MDSKLTGCHSEQAILPNEEKEADVVPRNSVRTSIDVSDMVS